MHAKCNIDKLIVSDARVLSVMPGYSRIHTLGENPMFKRVTQFARSYLRSFGKFSQNCETLIYFEQRIRDMIICCGCSEVTSRDELSESLKNQIVPDPWNISEGVGYKKNVKYNSSRVQSWALDTDLHLDLEVKFRSHFKVNLEFSNRNPYFWFQKWKERKILRSDMWS